MSGQATIGIGIVGAGSRGVFNLGTLIERTNPLRHLEVRAICDNHPPALEEAQRHLLGIRGRTAESLRAHAAYDELIADPAVDVVMVTTPQFVHRAPVVASLQAGKLTYCDKPLAHTVADADAIAAAEREAGSPVLVGFTRRYENAWRKAAELTQSGAVGTPQMLLLRSVIPFHVYFQRWFRKSKWSGGVLNEKCAHHFDVLNWFARSKPVSITAVGGRSVYLERPDAPTCCRECDDPDCPYRSGGGEIGARGRGRPGTNSQTDEQHRFDTCVYAPGADLLDHGIVTVDYENGVKACLFFSIFGPRADDQETLEVLGDSGRLRLIRHTAEVEVVSNYGHERQVYDCRGRHPDGGHFGADRNLIAELAAFARGAQPPVSALDGALATRMAAAASRSVEAGGLPFRPDDDLEMPIGE